MRYYNVYDFDMKLMKKILFVGIFTASAIGIIAAYKNRWHKKRSYEPARRVKRLNNTEINKIPHEEMMTKEITTETTKIEPTIIPVPSPEEKGIITTTPSKEEQPVSAKAKEAGQSLKDLIVALGKKAKVVTKDTSREIKSKTIDIIIAEDSKDIQNLGANIDSIITTFEDTMAEIHKEGYDEQEKLLADYKKFLEAQIKIVNARMKLAKQLKPGA
jgi:hypothetical protein